MKYARHRCIVASGTRATSGLLLTAGFLIMTPTPSDASDSAVAATEYHPHAEVSCSTCHGGKRAPDAVSVSAQADVCTTCHEQASPVEISLGAWGPDGWAESETPPADDHGSSCTRCHSFHEPTTITFGDRQIDIANTKVATHCQSCHSHTDANRLQRLTEGHTAAGALYHWLGPELAEYTPSDACLVCHDRDHRLPTNLPVVLPATPRFETHASHPYGIRMDGGDFFRPVIDSRIPLFDDRIECQTCHDLSAETEDLVIRFETKYEMCRGCHTQGLPKGQFEETFVER